MQNRYNSSREFVIEKIARSISSKEVIVNKISEDHYKLMILANHIKHFKKELLIDCQFREDKQSIINVYYGGNETSAKKYIFEVTSSNIDLEKFSGLIEYLENNFNKTRRLARMV